MSRRLPSNLNSRLSLENLQLAKQWIKKANEIHSKLIDRLPKIRSYSDHNIQNKKLTETQKNRRLQLDNIVDKIASSTSEPILVETYLHYQKQLDPLSVRTYNPNNSSQTASPNELLRLTLSQIEKEIYPSPLLNEYGKGFIESLFEIDLQITLLYANFLEDHWYAAMKQILLSTERMSNVAELEYVECKLKIVTLKGWKIINQAKQERQRAIKEEAKSSKRKREESFKREKERLDKEKDAKAIRIFILTIICVGFAVFLIKYLGYDCKSSA